MEKDQDYPDPAAGLVYPESIGQIPIAGRSGPAGFYRPGRRLANPRVLSLHHGTGKVLDRGSLARGAHGCATPSRNLVGERLDLHGLRRGPESGDEDRRSADRRLARQSADRPDESRGGVRARLDRGGLSGDSGRRYPQGRALHDSKAGVCRLPASRAPRRLESLAKQPRDDRNNRADEKNRRDRKEKSESGPVDDDIAWQAKQRQAFDPGPGKA